MLAVDFAGVKLRNPLVIGAGPYSCDTEIISKNMDKIAETGWGGVILKSICIDEKLTEKRYGAHPHIFPVMGKQGRLIGLQNYGPFFTFWPDIESIISEVITTGKEKGVLIIPSVIAENINDWVSLACNVEESGAEIVELDLSCPVAPDRVKKGEAAVTDLHPELIEEVVSAVKSRCNIPIIAKLGPNLYDLSDVAKAAERGGASVIAAVNTVLGLSGIDVETGIPLDASANNKAIFAGLSGDLLRPIGLRCVGQVASAVKIPIFGIGGISNWQSAVEYIMVGATCLQVVTAVMLQGFGVVTTILEGLTAFMERKGYKSLDDFRGKSLEYIIGDFYQLSERPMLATIETRDFAPCQATCPAGVDVRGYIGFIMQGKFRGALEVHRRTTPFAGVLGRVCTHPCETECERGKLDEPIAIRALKRFMADYELEAGREKTTPVKKAKADKVAIIGAGPAGLSCAYDLVRKGYPVTVFEAAPQAGGMLRYSIPEYRLPKAILDNEISLIEELGVEIKTNTPVKNLADIRDYKAVFIAAGAGTSQKMDIPNEEAKGIMHALDFLKQVTSGERVSLGNRVAVIGGGNAAIDAARAARNLGTKEVSIVYRRSRVEMPAIKSEIEQAELEGVKINLLAVPVRVLTKGDRVTGIQCIRMELGKPDASGRRRPIPTAGSEFDMAVDNVIIAIGQEADKAMLPGELEYTEEGTLSIDPVTMQTNVKGVFAGGDIVQVADVIKAIAAGKEAAISIERYLEGMALREGRPVSMKRVGEVLKDKVSIKARKAMPLLEPEKRVGFAEVELGFDEKTAVEEAERCLQCGVCSKCWVCVTSCTGGSAGAMTLKDDQLLVDEDLCLGCGLCATVCPSRAVELVFKE